MARRREQRLRRKARAQLRAMQRRLDETDAMRPVFLAAVLYVDEIYAPNLREPFSIANRRMDLVEAVRMYRHRHARITRRAA